MAKLTKKYRVIWDCYTLNIQNEYERDCIGSITMITDIYLKFGTYESDNYQDILDKIENKGLHPIGEWIEYPE